MKTTKTDSNRELAGTYSETKIDLIKKASNRLVSICGKFYTVITADGEMIEFSGRRKFDTWATKNEYATDF